jgi:peroxiredoxin
VIGTLAQRMEYRAWQKRYDPFAPKEGDVAPDFELRDSSGENLVRLSDFRGKKPVALVFGSFT